VFDRDPGTNMLSPRAIVSVPGFADNIELVANGDLLLGVHTKVLEFLQHVRDPWQPSPSHVVWLHGDGNGSFVPETIYYESGARLSGLSVAASLGQRMLLGSIFEHKILDCAWQAGP